MTLELKNDLKVIGNVQSVDENMNFFLSNMKLADEERNPYLVSRVSMPPINAINE